LLISIILSPNALPLSLLTLSTGSFIVWFLPHQVTYELLPYLQHYYNGAGVGSTAWNAGAGVGSTAWNAGAAFGKSVISNPVMFQNFSNKNFELVVREFDDLLRHYLNDLGSGTNAWNRGAPVYD
jgi:hypothetical protein